MNSRFQRSGMQVFHGQPTFVRRGLPLPNKGRYFPPQNPMQFLLAANGQPAEAALSALARRRRMTNRWFGWLFRLGGKTEQNDPHSKRIRAIDNNLNRLCDSLEGRLVRLEHSFDRIEFTVNRQYDALVELASGAVPAAKASAQPAAAPTAPRRAKPASQQDLSPRASLVLRGLRAARAAASSNAES